MSSSASLPPDLRVLCRKLTSIPPAQLPHSLPSLVNHVLRCREPLSAPQDQKLRDNASEGSLLVHKLKTNIGTLLNGRSREGRFAAIGLVKAVVDVGGWEVLRGAGLWVRGLLSIVQKGDPIASKELAVVALTRIYMLLHPYPTLVREIATPTIPEFISACLQIIKAPSPDQASTAPLPVVETVCDAFSTLTPLYPTTVRPSSSKIKNAVRLYLAPTESDGVSIPEPLRQAARRLVVLLHHVAAKSGGSDEWAKLVGDILKEFHSTADQVLRAVDESWEPSDGQGRQRVDLGGEPRGGGPSSEELPPWSGLHAGAERLTGLLHYLSACLQYPTKAAVTLPTSAIVDAASRLCLIAQLSPKVQTWDQAVQTNSAIGREEREELWSLMPDLHFAALGLAQSLIQRLGRDALPLIPEVLDHLVRVFKSGMDNPDIRMIGYSVLNVAISLSGPTMDKPAVDMLDPLARACCRDLQQDAGQLKRTPKAQKPNTGASNSGTATNADSFLKTPDDTAEDAATLQPDHKAAARALLTTVLARLPQQHLKPGLRGLLERTAVLVGDRDAMLASVLNPYRDPGGRVHPSILPHLSRQFPEDPGLEIVRTNLRADAARAGDDVVAPPLDELEEEEDEGDADENMEDEGDALQEPAKEAVEDPWRPATLPTAPEAQVDLPIQGNPFEPSKAEKPTAFGDIRPEAESPPKRKFEGAEPAPAKRHEVGVSASRPDPVREPAPRDVAEASQGEDDSDDESVHLNMELDDLDEDEDEDED